MSQQLELSDYKQHIVRNSKSLELTQERITTSFEYSEDHDDSLREALRSNLCNQFALVKDLRLLHYLNDQVKFQENNKIDWQDIKSVKPLARGEFAYVHKVNFLRSTNRKTKHIIKVTKLSGENLEKYYSEFLGEAELLLMLSHPNIVKCFGYGVAPQPFILLEECVLGSLSKRLGYHTDENGISRPKRENGIDASIHYWLHRYRFTLKHCINYANQLAAGLEYLHSKAILNHIVLHRDLKPDNIGFSQLMGTKERVVKLLDFGLAKVVTKGTGKLVFFRKTMKSDETGSMGSILDEQRAATYGSQMADMIKEEVFDLSGDTGSRRYMAPEVALSKAYNEKADVYSFAFIVWEMFTGCQPFEELNLVDFYSRVVMAGERPDLSNHPSGVFNGEQGLRIANLLSRCWSKEFLLRPTFTQIVEELREIQNGGK